MAAYPAPTRSLQLADDTTPVVFCDGSRLELRRLTQYGQPARMLRALPTQRAGRAIATVVDLGKLSRDLDNELRLAADRDADGLVMFTLRQRYANANEARAAMARHTIAILPEA